MARISSFIFGGLVGAGLALLFSPRTGEQNRAFVTEKANAVVGEAKDFGANFPESAQDALKSAKEQGSAFINDASAKGQEFAKDAKGKTSGFVNDAASKVKAVAGKGNDAEGDDLREKIEAARQRIAAQVMENAEKSKVGVDNAAEAVVEKVESVSDKADDAAEGAAEKVQEAAEKTAEKADEVAAKAEEAKHAK